MDVRAEWKATRVGKVLREAVQRMLMIEGSDRDW